MSEKTLRRLYPGSDFYFDVRKEESFSMRNIFTDGEIKQRNVLLSVRIRPHNIII